MSDAPPPCTSSTVDAVWEAAAITSGVFVIAAMAALILIGFTALILWWRDL